MSTTQIEHAPRELAHRTGDGFEVLLLWRPDHDCLVVVVHDWHAGTAFELAVGDHPALDVFHHPFAYAGRAGFLDDPVPDPPPDGD
jgi:hypothetical protein